MSPVEKRHDRLHRSGVAEREVVHEEAHVRVAASRRARMLRSANVAAHALGPPASVPMRPRARLGEPRLPDERLPLHLLLPGLPSIRSVPRTGGRARPVRRNGHLPDAARARDARGGRGRDAVREPFEQGSPLVRRLLPDPDREHRRGTAFPGHRHDSFLHGPRGRRPFPGRGAWSAALPHLRRFRRRDAPTGRAPAAVARRLRPPRLEDSTLVGGRAQPADAVLRRSNPGSTRRTARSHAGLARGPCRGPPLRARPAVSRPSRGHPGRRALEHANASPCSRKLRRRRENDDSHLRCVSMGGSWCRAHGAARVNRRS